MPSRRESFGMAAVEACACGLPVVATNIGGIPEIVVHGENGFLCNSEATDEIADAMARLARDASLRKQMGMNGRKRVESLFDEARAIDRTLQLYSRLYPGGHK